VEVGAQHRGVVTSGASQAGLRELRQPFCSRGQRQVGALPYHPRESAESGFAELRFGLARSGKRSGSALFWAEMKKKGFALHGVSL